MSPSHVGSDRFVSMVVTHHENGFSHIGMLDTRPGEYVRKRIDPPTCQTRLQVRSMTKNDAGDDRDESAGATGSRGLNFYNFYGSVVMTFSAFRMVKMPLD
jgi:hypothetical protein